MLWADAVTLVAQSRYDDATNRAQQTPFRGRIELSLTQLQEQHGSDSISLRQAAGQTADIRATLNLDIELER